MLAVSFGAVRLLGRQQEIVGRRFSDSAGHAGLPRSSIPTSPLLGLR